MLESSKDYKTFLDRAGGNATYTSKMTVVEFVNAPGTGVEVSPLKRLHKAPFFSIMADECTDVTSIEELTIVVVGWRVVFQKKTSLKFYS